MKAGCGEKVKAIKLDSFIKGDATFIKMDIEGSELDAIAGARELILRCRPILAVSIYHSVCDLWEIPLLINDIVPDYKLYVRHHSILEGETVLYALL